MGLMRIVMKVVRPANHSYGEGCPYVSRIYR
jgi:hypothetical protein